MIDTAAQIAELREKAEAVRKAEADCPANKAHLGNKPCPTCYARPSEGCGITGPRYYEAAVALRNTALPIIDAQAAEIEALKAELDEQARINGMGGEREAALMAERDRLREAGGKLAAQARSYERGYSGRIDLGAALNNWDAAARAALTGSAQP